MSFMPDFALAAPEIWVAAMICIVLVADLFVPGKNSATSYYLTLLTLAVAAWLTIDAQWGAEAMTFSDMYIADSLGVVLKVAIYGLAALAFVYSRDSLIRNKLMMGEFFVLGLFAVLGMMVLSSANSLLTIYVGLEMFSLAMYALVAFNRNSGTSAEAALKYFVLGALSSGILLYGMSMVYGGTGSLDLGEIAAVAAADGDNILLLFGLAFLIVGVAFKFGAVPFHMWIPDVYQGAPTPVTLYLGTAPKVASVALFMRLIGDGLGAFADQWQTMLIVLVILSLAVGNIAALVQTNFKRLLAYSTVSHVGFILLGLMAGTEEGYAAGLFYAVTYGITAAGAFAMVMLLQRDGHEIGDISDLRGLFQRHGWSALVLLLLMFSMTGIPGTVGFYAKLLVIQAAVNVGHIWLAALAIVFSVIGGFYYLKVLKVAFFDKPEGELEMVAPGGYRAVLAGNGLAVLLLGLFPQALIAVCMAALA